MLRIIITLLAIGTIHTTTTLTTNNCPSNFNLTLHNITDTQNQNLAQSLYSSVLSTQLKNIVINKIAQGQLFDIFSHFTSMSFLLPYLLLLIFFSLFYCCTICCCIFQRRCPPCQTLRRNYLKDPYSPCEKRSTMIIALIFSTGILIATIIVFSSFTTLKSDIQMVKCSMFYSLDIASNGEQTKNWGGFGQVQSQLSSITGLINSTATTVDSSLSSNEWIITGYETMQNMNLALYTDNKDSVVYSPNPTTTHTQRTTGGSLPTITPKFIQSGLGPNGTADTMVTDIDLGLAVTKNVTDQAQITYRSAMTFSSSASNITYNTNNNLQSLTQITTLLQKVNTALQTFDKNYLSYTINYSIYGLQVAFGIILLASLISLMGMISTHIFDLFACTKMVNAGWILFGLIYFFIVAVLITILAIGGVSHSFCTYLGTILNDSSQFASYSLKSQHNSFNHLSQYLDICFFGDGNILKKFTVSSEMDTVSNLFQNTQTYLNMQTTGNTLYVDLTQSTSKIIGWMTAMNKYGNGIYIDTDTSVTSQDNPNVALANLNLITLLYNTTSSQNLCVNDFWVFDSTNCSNSSSQSLYTPSGDNTNGISFASTGSLCLSLNTRLSNSAPSIWTSSDLALRYLSKRSCNSPSSQTAYQNLLKYTQSLTNYRDTRLNLYQSLYDQLNSLLTTNTAYNTNMTTFTGNVNNFYSSVATLNNLVTNQINGLTISSNCTAIADAFRFFHNTYCVNFVNRTIKIAVSSIVIITLMLGGIIAGAIFGVRFQRVAKEHRLTKVDELQSEVFREEESAMSSQSVDSHNSEQDNN